MAGVTRTNEGLTQAQVEFSSFWTVRRRNRPFVVAVGGTSFDGKPLPTEQFSLGRTFRLDAFSVGERRGDHVLLGTVGYLRQVGRLRISSAALYSPEAGSRMGRRSTATAMPTFTRNSDSASCSTRSSARSWSAQALALTAPGARSWALAAFSDEHTYDRVGQPSVVRRSQDIYNIAWTGTLSALIQAMLASGKLRPILQ